MFITWQKTVGGRIKNDPAFSNTLTWNSFPLPDLREKEQQLVIEAGMGVVEARERACQMVCVSRTERNGKNHDHDRREEAGRW